VGPGVNLRALSLDWIGMPYSRRAAPLLLAALLAGCGQVSPTVSPTASAPRAAGETLVMGLGIPPFAVSPLVRISNAQPGRFIPYIDLLMRFVYNALYRYDDTLTPVPDLASEPCEIASDQVTITCRIAEATFHDGTPLTADDVVFTYELARREPECLFAVHTCPGQMLESVRAVDERTVEFRLTAPNATFMTLVLPSVLIESRKVIEAAYAPLAERAPSLDAAEYEAAAEALVAPPREGQERDCEGGLADSEALFEAAGLEPLPREMFNRGDGSFDACMYADTTSVMLRAVGQSLGASGLDAIALAYRTLSHNAAPVGTGPWRFSGVEDGNRGIFEAFEDYHRGPPATPRLEFRVLREDPVAQRQMVLDGELDWYPIPVIFPETVEALRDAPNLQFTDYPDTTFFMLAFNVREGRLFADQNLRAALELCIDKPATVDAATDGTGDVLYSPVDPVSWAYDPDIPRPERDVDEARRLIEESGWIEGDDGIYTREGRRLATDVFVRDDDAQRIEFMDLVSEQVGDCGIELNVVPADGESVLDPISEYPHIPGGYEEPFDAIFYGWAHALDPHDTLFHSSAITSEEQRSTFNIMGFSDPRVDALLDEGIATYDLRERARIYREYQRLLAEQRPVLFGWSARQYDALDARLALTDGEINTSSRHWYWELEKLVLRSE
jgi:ABC-type transport system substrate-binding protein